MIAWPLTSLIKNKFVKSNTIFGNGTTLQYHAIKDTGKNDTEYSILNPMAKTSRSNPESVTDHIQNLSAEVRDIVAYIRQEILKIDPEIKDHIKWNSPAFYFSGPMADFAPKEYRRDMMVFNLYKGRIILVFPTGAMIKDATGILEGTYTDGRRLITLTDMADTVAKISAIKKVIKSWLQYTRANQA